FFQAEDGIRDRTVTGVQTCALPISSPPITPGSATRSSSRYAASRTGRIRHGWRGSRTSTRGGCTSRMTPRTGNATTDRAGLSAERSARHHERRGREEGAVSATDTSQTLTGEFIRLYPDQVAHILEELPAAETARLIEATAPSNAAGLLERLNPRVAAGVIAELGDEAARAALKSMLPTKAAPIL